MLYLLLLLTVYVIPGLIYSHKCNLKSYSPSPPPAHPWARSCMLSLPCQWSPQLTHRLPPLQTIPIPGPIPSDGPIPEPNPFPIDWTLLSCVRNGLQVWFNLQPELRIRVLWSQRLFAFYFLHSSSLRVYPFILCLTYLYFCYLESRLCLYCQLY